MVSTIHTSLLVWFNAIFVYYIYLDNVSTAKILLRCVFFVHTIIIIGMNNSFAWRQTCYKVSLVFYLALLRTMSDDPNFFTACTIFLCNDLNAPFCECQVDKSLVFYIINLTFIWAALSLSQICLGLKRKNDITRCFTTCYVVMSCGGRTRTCDLQVMSLASYQLLHSAILKLSISQLRVQRYTVFCERANFRWKKLVFGVNIFLFITNCL